jgi:hypothetical protein
VASNISFNLQKGSIYTRLSVSTAVEQPTHNPKILGSYPSDQERKIGIKY